MTPVLRCRVYYADGRTVDVVGPDAWKALPDGVALVVQFEVPPYRRIVDAGDWYFVEDGVVRHTPSSAAPGAWQPRPPGCRDCVKRSAPTLPDDVFGQLSAQAWGDRRWP